MRRIFVLGDVLTAATGHLVSPRGMEGVYDVLNFLTGDNLYTHQLPRALTECQPWVLRQHPQLAGVTVEGVNADNLGWWLQEQEAQFGATLALEPIPRDDHTFRDPVEELAEMVGRDRVIKVPVRPE